MINRYELACVFETFLYYMSRNIISDKISPEKIEENQNVRKNLKKKTDQSEMRPI